MTTAEVVLSCVVIGWTVLLSSWAWFDNDERNDDDALDTEEDTTDPEAEDDDEPGDGGINYGSRGDPRRPTDWFYYPSGRRPVGRKDGSDRG